MALTYETYTNAMRTMLVVPLNESDSNFENIIPRMIEYAELRIYRELDFLNTRSAPTLLCTSGSRNATVPATIVVLESVNLISPAGTTNPESGTRVPLERVSVDFLNFTWPTAATTGTPAKYALLSDTGMRLAPTPSGAFTLECVGTTRPTALSPTTTTTFISTYLPDLFLAASMIFGSGYQKNYGSQADDPKMAQSWESQYQALKAGVNLETIRQKAESVQWTPFQPSPAANQPRDRSAA